MREQKYLYGFASVVRDYINKYIRDGWYIEPTSIHMIGQGDCVYSCALLYREKGE